jgi:deoxyribonuclease V
VQSAGIKVFFLLRMRQSIEQFGPTDNRTDFHPRPEGIGYNDRVPVRRAGNSSQSGGAALGREEKVKRVKRLSRKYVPKRSGQTIPDRSRDPKKERQEEREDIPGPLTKNWIPPKTARRKNNLDSRTSGGFTAQRANVKAQNLHPWRMSAAKAGAIQETLRKKLTLKGNPGNIKLIAGADLSYPRFSSRAVAGIVVLSWPEMEVVETRTVWGTMRFPYVPGYLSFREGPLLLRAFERLRSDPSLLFFDGQGVAHPRGFGLANHMGLLLDRPSLGCAKSLLFGNAAEPGAEAGRRTALHALSGERIGTVLRTRKNVKPIYVSPGHRIGMKAATEWAYRMARGYRIPEPTRLAHLLVNRKREEKLGLNRK